MNTTTQNQTESPRVAPASAQERTTGTGARNLAEIYRQSAERFGDRPAFVTRNAQKEFIPISFARLYETGVALATGLIDLGLEAREHVGLLADNRQEWITADYGVILTGAADVPRGTDVTRDETEYILSHADARIVFVENSATLEKVLSAKVPQLERIVLMDPETPARGDLCIPMNELIRTGRHLRAEGDRRVEARVAAIRPDDLFTIIYTSGTTGAPKGVMLSHANMLSQLRNIPLRIDPRDRMLSILPVWHIFERVFEMATIATGVPQYYSSVRTIREDMRLVRPTFMASAPRLWESVYQGIQTKIKDGPAVSRGLFRAAYFCALKVRRALRFLRGNELDLTGRSPLRSVALLTYHSLMLPLFALPYLLLNAVVLKKIRAATGGKLRGTISGGGALPLHVDEFFNTIGIPVYEGYGLTETSPGLAFRTPGKAVIGSVGPLFPETELRLVDLNTGEIVYPPRRGVKGEIHVRGPQVMRGYYKNQAATERVLTSEGWFNTGDLGVMTCNDTLKIVGRSKETVVLLNGENIEPVPIENRLLQSPLIDHVMVVGQDKKYLGALVVPAADAFNEFGANLEMIAASPEARRLMLKEIKSLISAENGFKTFEKIADVRLLPKTLEVGDELSAKMSMKRHVITEKYAGLIEEMYR